MKDRIKELRKALKLTQVEFASKISIRQSTYAGYEAGKSKPSNPAIDNICKTFGVNEQWLRTGEGEMFAPKGDSIDDLMKRYQLHPRCRSTLETVLAMPEAAQEAFVAFLDGMKEQWRKEDGSSLRAQMKAEVRDEVRAEVEAEIRAELEQEKEDKEAEALHILLQAQIDRQKGDKGSPLVFGGTNSKKV